jgi:hypothetical protein
MKLQIFVMFAVAIFLAGIPIGAESQTSASPSAAVANPVYQFAPVFEGTQVTHDYIIQNKGSETLEIQKVKPG